MTKKYVMLVMANADNNNNKFYELKLEDDESVISRYGRVGAAGVTENKGHGEATFDKVANAKRKKGYKDVEILTTTSATSTASGNVSEIAKRDVAKNNPILEKLIDKLAKINRHQLLGASGGNIDIVDGQVKTPLGLVTLDSIAKAKTKLNELDLFVKAKDLSRSYISTLEDYLTLVPQKVPAKRGWHENFFVDVTNFANQSALLEQIELSIKNYQPPTPTNEAIAPEKIFGYSLNILDDDKIFDSINKFYNDGINRMHVTRGYKLKKVYVLINEEKKKNYDEIAAKLGNIKKLWHGTRACNVLSILKGGLIIPPTTGGNYTIAGRMFSDGIYQSDQSSKALNYATPYWTGGKNDLDELYMLLSNTSMGKEYIPPGPMSRFPSGYDSIFAIGGKSGVMNNEMIVPNPNQIHLQYLCEFLE